VREVDVYDALQNTTDAGDVLIGNSAYGYDWYWPGGIEGYGGTAKGAGG
jgi:hypothetical protein